MKDSFPPPLAMLTKFCCIAWAGGMMQQTLAVPKQGISTVLDVASLSKGLYFAELLDANGHRFATAKFTKI